MFNKNGKKSFINTKNNIKKINNIRNNKKIAKDIVESSKSIGKGIKTSRNTFKTTKTISKNIINNKKKVIKNTKKIVRNSYQSVKMLIKLTMKTIKGIIKSTKALIDLLIAGGWIAVVIIIVICIIGVLCSSIFGIFFTNEASDNGITMSDVIMEINKELSIKIEEEKKSKQFDEININANISNWKEVFTIYSVVNSKKGKDSVTLDGKKINDIKKIFWQFNSIKSYIKEEDRNTNIVKVLYIEIESKDITSMERLYELNSSQIAEVRELLNDEYSSMWNSVIYGSVNEKGWIFPIKDVYIITNYYSKSLDLCQVFRHEI